MGGERHGKGPVHCTVSEPFQAMMVSDGGLVRSGPSWRLSPFPAEGSRVGLVESRDHPSSAIILYLWQTGMCGSKRSSMAI